MEDNLTYPEEPKEINLFEKSTDIPIKYPNSARTNKERALKSALDELNLISIEINLPESKRNYILNTYSILYEKGYTNGRSRKLILLSIIRGKSL